jgi:uncharacterized 2Fe-2S/4Fe-4S cluster protein (DUF4445 family)
MKANKVLEIEILPDKIKHQFSSPVSLRKVFEELNLHLLYPCGGNHSCGKCAVQFIGQYPDPTYQDSLFFTPQEIRQGWRLSCFTQLGQSSTVLIPDENRLNHLTGLKTSVIEQIPVQPPVRKYFLKLPVAEGLENLKSDVQLVQEELERACQIRAAVLLSVLRRLPAVLRENDYQVTVTVRDRDIIDVEGGNTTEQAYGLAIDLGTTTVVVSLHHLLSGETIDIAASINPQARFGSDLISRLTYISQQADGLEHLHKVMVQGINSLITDLCKMHQVDTNNVYMMTVSGNAGMNHLLLGVNPQSLALAPYTPVFKELRKERASELDLAINAEAGIVITPNLGGFVGGDVLADMLVAGFGKKAGESKLLIDIGTNCEVVIETDSSRLTASSPAGPALEGASISFGMRAESGAIYDAHWQGSELLVETIDDEPARGICGSGLFHLIDVLIQKKIIKPAGKWNDRSALADAETREFYRQRMGLYRGEYALLIAGVLQGAKRNIYLTQTDIRAFQLAKSAITSAWQVLCRLAEIQPLAIENVYLAGAFGNFIRPQTAVDLKLVPALDLNRIHFIGNASLEGARRILLDQDQLQQVDKLATGTRFVELAGRADFQDLYVQNMMLYE